MYDVLKNLPRYNDLMHSIQENVCRYKPQFRAATDKGYVDLPQGDEEALKEAVATIGPVSVGIALASSFYQYKSGTGI